MFANTVVTDTNALREWIGISGYYLMRSRVGPAGLEDANHYVLLTVQPVLHQIRRLRDEDVRRAALL